MALQTLNQLNKAFNTIANAHLQVKTYGFGQVMNIATSGTIQHPLMWVELENATNRSDGTFYQFTFYLMDIVKNDLSNELEVLSDMFKIAEDIIAEIRHKDWTFYVIREDILIDYYTEGFTDKVTGVKFNINIGTETPNDRCAIPETSITRT